MIKIQDQLPPIFEDVIIYSDYGYLIAMLTPEIGECPKQFLVRDFHDEDIRISLNEISHWSPLPCNPNFMQPSDKENDLESIDRN